MADVRLNTPFFLEIIMSIETTHNAKEINSIFNDIRVCIDNNTNINCENHNENKKELSKAEKCRIIREHFYNTEYAHLYPESYKSIIHSDTPMLCLRMKSLENKDQIELWKSDEYIADEKIDGIRCYLAFNYAYDKNNGYELFGRENDEDTLLPKNITNNFIKLNIKSPDQFYKTFLLDCELVIEENKYKLYAFDCIYFNDNYITEEPWYFRRYITEHIVESISDRKITVTKYSKIKKIDFYNHIKNKGGEGVVIKNFSSKYSTKGTRSKYNWVKVKGNAFDYSIIEDTLEGFVSDLVKTDQKMISLSAFVDSEISKPVADIPTSYLNTICVNSFNNQQTLNIGSVIEFSSSFFSFKEDRFMNAIPIKIRMDKSIKDCFYTKNDIDRWTA